MLKTNVNFQCFVSFVLVAGGKKKERENIRSNGNLEKVECEIVKGIIYHLLNKPFLNLFHSLTKNCSRC